MKRFIVAVIALFCLLVPATALAYNPLSTACSAGGGAANSSPACTGGTSDPITGPNGVLKKVSLVLAFIASVTAIIIIMTSGFNYITSGGDAKKTESAKNGIVGAVIGLVIIAAGETIVVFVVSKL